MKVEMPDGNTYDADKIPMSAFESPKAPAVDGFNPTEGQSRAADKVAALMKTHGRGLLVIKGYAGTGKTTMLQLFAHVYGTPLVVTPTGKAALRVTEATGLEASTIHRWLYRPAVDGRGRMTFTLRGPSDLWIPPSRLLLIDEASMVGLSVWQDVWRAAEAHGLKIVAVGDGFQLPPVQDKGAAPFSLLDDAYVRSLGGEVTELNEVLRQALDSPIVRVSMRLRDPAESATAAMAELQRIQKNDLLDACLACRGAGGVVLSHANVTRHRVNWGMRGEQQGPQAGEPLLVLRNNYDVEFYNGEQVTFEGWTEPPGAQQHIVDRYSNAAADVSFGVASVDGQRVILSPEELSGSCELGGFTLDVAAENWARANSVYTDRGTLVPHLQANYGYCYTVHKAQGSEWPFALVICEPTVKLQTEEGKRWAYTAITRAKEACAVYYGRL